MFILCQKVFEFSVEIFFFGLFDFVIDGFDFVMLVVFYCGLYCLICVIYLKEFGCFMFDFVGKGVKIIVILFDFQDWVQQMVDKVGYVDLWFGYGLLFEKVCEWGFFIFISCGKMFIGIVELDLFFELGVFLVCFDGILYFFVVQIMLFVCLYFQEMVGVFDFVQKNDYFVCGEYIGVV